MDELQPTTIVIFGASGDLTKRKLVPALFQLFKEKLLPEKIRIVGFARKEKSSEQFRDEMNDALLKFSRAKPKENSKELKEFLPLLYYQTGLYDDSDSFKKLKSFLSEIEGDEKVNRLYYLSTPPRIFFGVVKMLGETGFTSDVNEQSHWTRVIIEKPFGRDLKSAKELNRNILSVVNEEQIFRIDHYLGKETVQNIMAFRFGNSIFEPLWNRRYVDHVQITVAESVSVGSRGGYYDNSGALRDMVQNHILQLLALIAMEPPASFAANAVRDEKVKVLHAIRLMKPEEVGQFTIRGQYEGGSINGTAIPGYLSEPGVMENSKTETYAALKLFVDNWRWADIPFYIRTGKALSKRITEITIQFKQPPLALFEHAHHEGHKQGDGMRPNMLSLRVQPNESIQLQFGLKIPGPSMILRPTEMEFFYSDEFEAQPPEAYERLILDAILGDSTLFIRHDEVEAAWGFIDTIFNGWSSDNAPQVYGYEAGSWGPTAADEFMQKDNRKWTVTTV